MEEYIVSEVMSDADRLTKVEFEQEAQGKTLVHISNTVDALLDKVSNVKAPTSFKDIIIREEITIDDLKGKTLAVDSYNMLYQFLTTIRARDGTVLMDSKGNVTSHLVGLFNRTTKLMSQGIKLSFVFDEPDPDRNSAV